MADKFTETTNIGKNMNNAISYNEMDRLLGIFKEVGLSMEPRFVIDRENWQVYLNLIFWLQGNRRMVALNPFTNELMAGRMRRGIYLAGNVGSGKSLAMKVLRELYSSCRNRFCPKPPRWVEIRADDLAMEYAITGDIVQYQRAELLCIQDLGTEPLWSVNMGNRINVLQKILEYRGDHPELITMVTSNIPLDDPELIDRYGERAVSRMCEMMNFLLLTGADRRKNF